MASSESTRGRPSDQSSNHANERDLDSSPDYASSRHSQDSNRMNPLPKARTGVLKTVGDPSLDPEAPAPPPKSDIPEIDFGITQSLSPLHRRPGTALGITGRRPPLDGFDNSTPDRHLAHTPGPRAPDGLLRSSLSGTGSPASSRGNSISWKPAQHLGRESPGPGLSAEEFVQQRYAMASRPTGYIPHRTVSSGGLETTVAGPKKLHKKRDSYSSTHSVMNTDYSSNLSAREQEHVARMTGGPLLNLNDRSKTPDPSVGLIGAIEAREQEKKFIKDGVSGHMVQAAIAQRQQQAQTQQLYAARVAAERAYAQQYTAYPQSQLGYAQPTYYQQQWPNLSAPELQAQQHPQQQQQWGGQQYQQRFGGYY